MNAKELADTLKLDITQVTGKLRRHGIKAVNGSPLSQEAIALVCETYQKEYTGRSKATNVAAARLLRQLDAEARAKALLISEGEQVEDEQEQPGGFSDWAKVAAISPLPVLGLVASYGVFSFALHFVPFWMALLEAASFEVIYIALAALSGLDEGQRRRAKVVSLGALIVSVAYGSIAAALHLVGGDTMESLPLSWVITFAALHGIPVPVLAYAVANLLLHRK